MFVIAPAALGQRDAARGAVQQNGAQAPFEAVDQSRYRRCGETKLARRGGKAAAGCAGRMR